MTTEDPEHMDDLDRLCYKIRRGIKLTPEEVLAWENSNEGDDNPYVYEELQKALLFYLMFGKIEKPNPN